MRTLFGPDGSSAFSADQDNDALASRSIDSMDAITRRWQLGLNLPSAGLCPSESWLAKNFAPHAPAMEGNGEGTHVEQSKMSAILTMEDLDWQFDCSIFSKTRRWC